MRNGGFLLHATLCTYLVIMELRFDVILYSEWGDENSDAGHIKCSRGPHLARGPQVPHPWRRWLWLILLKLALWGQPYS